MTFLDLFILIALVFFSLFQLTASAGNDDPTFDWLKEDDHIISSHDVNYLRSVQLEQSKEQPRVHTIPQVPRPNRAIPAVGKPSTKRHQSRTPEQKQRRRERDRKNLQDQKDKNPAGYRAYRKKRVDYENARKELIPLQVRKQQYKERYQVYKKKADSLARTAEGAKKLKEKATKTHLNYKANLGQKISNGQATEKQIATYKRTFGQKNYEKLIKKE